MPGKQRFDQRAMPRLSGGSRTDFGEIYPFVIPYEKWLGVWEFAAIFAPEEQETAPAAEEPAAEAPAAEEGELPTYQPKEEE